MGKKGKEKKKERNNKKIKLRRTFNVKEIRKLREKKKEELIKKFCKLYFPSQNPSPQLMITSSI